MQEAHNPYAAPAAVVTDIATVEWLARPWQVKAALYLFWLSALATVPVVIYEFTHRNPASRTPDLDRVAMQVSLGLMLVVMLMVFAALWKGWRWGRIVYGVMVVLGTVAAFQGIPRQFGREWYLGTADLLGTLIEIAAAILLFTTPANAWFRQPGR